MCINSFLKHLCTALQWDKRPKFTKCLCQQQELLLDCTDALDPVIAFNACISDMYNILINQLILFADFREFQYTHTAQLPTPKQKYEQTSLGQHHIT